MNVLHEMIGSATPLSHFTPLILRIRASS
jgi:hypothetical protein